MTTVEEATRSLASAESELEEATAEVTAAHESVVRELIGYMPTWWLEQARTEVGDRAEVAQRLGREVIQTFRREVESLAARAEEVIRLGAARSTKSFPHLDGDENNEALQGSLTPYMPLPVRELTAPLHDLMVKHHLLDPKTWDPRHRWEKGAWNERPKDAFTADGLVQAAHNAYKIQVEGWIKAVRRRRAAKSDLERARANDLWG